MVGPMPDMKVEIIASDALFSVLAWSGENIAMYVHPHNANAAELAWVMPVAQLVGSPQACYR